MDDRSFFDKFADDVAKRVARPGFFMACVLLVAVWLPSYFIFRSVDTWQLIINTITTIITFLLVALLQNQQDRFECAVNERLGEILKRLDVKDPVQDHGQKPS